VWEDRHAYFGFCDENLRREAAGKIRAWMEGNLKKLNVRGSGLDTLGSGDEHLAGCCEHGNEPSGSIILIFLMIYLLTAAGLTPGGSSAVHIYTKQ
jgi:hypothetical protein